ncbi:hypothetical protein CPB86DRAFT_715486 [Serendipita vermifera]|nr:hypothetical protein CPB86DRAFT_715486 [Serendipita vermifera]
MSNFREHRSKASPMDFEYASEEMRGPPAWSQNLESPQKRNEFGSTVPTTPQANRAMSPLFTQSPINKQLSFHTPVTSTPPVSIWKLPQETSPAKARMSSPAPELADVSMNSMNSSPLAAKGKGRESAMFEIPRKEEETEEQDESFSLVPLRKTSTSGVKAQRSIIREEEDEDEGELTDDAPQARIHGDSITANHHYTFNMPNAPESRSEIPYMLLGYVQFLFNLSLVIIFLYILVHCIITIQQDVEQRMKEYQTELAEKIATCAQLYEINKCFPISQRVPALAQHCADWESCMQRDPSGIGRAKVVAETIGEVINSFVEPISWKTLGFGLISLGFLITLINVLFSFYRGRIAPEHIMHPQVHPSTGATHIPPPLAYPATPVHPRIAQAYINPGGYVGAPLHQQVEWRRTWSGTEMPVPSTPSRKRQKTPAL